MINPGVMGGGDDHAKSIQPKKTLENLLNIFRRPAASSGEVCNEENQNPLPLDVTAHYLSRRQQSQFVCFKKNIAISNSFGVLIS